MIKDLIVDSKVCVYVKAHKYFDGFLNIGRIKEDDVFLLDKIFIGNNWCYNLLYIVYSPPLYKKSISSDSKKFYDDMSKRICDVIYINGINKPLKIGINDDELLSDEISDKDIMKNFIYIYLDIKENSKKCGVTKFIYGIKSTIEKRKVR